ncbi:uncharacterized protein LTR77_007921 [Saxophila tyrrhenica]|uniref:SH3 domain-containing protein n=1 Tax=Saxophila tyrrhenica TaxID=1690608 RepID=A0AAV9P3Y5_9PEZI|nr:hypothetical protein LTR77_007921 [Saxophila tyrrhenica]
MTAPPFKVKSVYEYTSEHEDDLNFPTGQIITVTELEGDDWYVGEYTDATGGKHEGLFPSNFVEKYEPEVPTRPTRPTRPKQEAQQPAAAAQPAPSIVNETAENEAPPASAATKPSAPPIEVPAASSTTEEVRSPPSASSQTAPATSMEKAPAPKPAPAEPAEGAKKAPPPVAAKSNAFKDRIAAFNQPAAAPLAPMQPGGKSAPSGGFIKKPFVAPPPSKSAYVPPPKVDPVQKPYVRDEDPEIRQRQEEDRAAAEAAGLANEASAAAPDEEEEDAPKPMTLKERMALLQKQQQEQAQRRADTAQKKEKKVPQKQASESSDQPAAPEAETESLERVRSDTTERASIDAPREQRRVPSTQRRPTEPMSPVPTPAEHEILSDGHEADQSGAGDLTEDDTGTLGPDDNDERQAEPMRHPTAPKVEPDVGDEEDTTEGDEGEEEEEMDDETRRKQELRARMARLGGGMPGMGQPFNPFGAPPPAPARKKQPSRDQQASEDAPSPASQQRAPMVPVPGMQRVQSPESDVTEKVPLRDEEVEGVEEEDAAPQPPSRTSTAERGAPPPVPKDTRPVPPPHQERAVPPPPPRAPATESRPVPPPPPPSGAPLSPGPGSESDDEMSSHAKSTSADASGIETPLPVRSRAPPVPSGRDVPPRPPQSPDAKRVSQHDSSEPPSASSDKRSSRVPPPVPTGSAPTSPRPPPPPPPTQMPSSMDIHEDERVGSDYDGDYDTDIASGAKHKDALKAPHNRESSLTDNSTADELSLGSPAAPPPAPAPRAVPPPPPEAAPKTRQSIDRPPPPIPSRDAAQDDPEYDPYRYNGGGRGVPPVPSGVPAAAPPPPPQEAEESSDDETYAPPSPPARKSTDRAPPPAPQERVVPPPPLQERAVPPPPSQAPPNTLAPSRTSTDIHRSQTTSRRSMDQARPSGEHGQIANELNLSTDTPWWTSDQPLPPSLQGRNGVDVLFECEETSKSKRGGRKEITKDIYILYMDYSQTVISARYDSQDPADVHFEQRHEPPAPKLRQDQLESAWQRFGTKIADAASQVGHSKKDAHVGDGTPQSLPFELIKAQGDALLPVGTRAYGALVYANLANASTMQFDEIRRGDIVTVRNARFEGHHGAMKTKYKTDYGPSHVAVVEEWDGTRRSVRVWEQGREKKGGVRSEKFRLGDLRSGEVRVWRVVGRDWVGWES